MAWVFAGIAGPMALSSWLNSRIVERIGSRRIMLRALGAFTFFAALHLALAAFHGETLLVFILLQALTMASFGLISANLGAIAMEPLGHIAATASSVQGMISTVRGSLLGLAFGTSFHGPPMPVLLGLPLCWLPATA